MQFKQYPSYKDSGVEWLGEVPEHWRISSLKRYGYFKGGAGFPHAYQGNTEENIPFFKVNSLSKDKRFLSSFSDFVGEETAKKLGAKIFPKNSIFFAKVGAALLLERIRTNQQPCCIDNNMMGFVIQNELSFDFAFYLMSLIDFKYLVNPGAVPSINESQISSFLISVPPISEQTQIANYLDTETARIDNLIAKQEKLIELLEEQRKSIISHAVTKGLNPNAPMKDSGVEWLGEVPEHWKVLKNRHIFNFSKGLSITKENLQESGIPCVSYGEVHSKFGFEFNPEINDMKFVSEEYLETSKNCLLNSGDFIFADTSEDFEGSGNFSYLNSNSQVFAGYHTVIARLKSKQKPRFFAYIFDSNAHRKQIQTQVKGIKVFSITQGILKDIYSWQPPIHEQDLIVEYLDNECKKISLLKAKQTELIEKLKEYRASIISHAVTGKIDVREFGA